MDARLSSHDACAEPPPPALRQAIEQFNQGEYFECHETLERLWLAERRTVRELYQGILQVGVGFYHLRRGNARGGLLTLERGLERLRCLPGECQGVKVDQLVADAEQVRQIVQVQGEAALNVLASGQLPHVQLVDEVVEPGAAIPPHSTRGGE